ncbi:MAG: MBL fold metallo-hydrolase [Verrucomicrobiaceae bacterium]|nr:MAG: MBL fold metallo-hydrolase [Verrucomicrobiaceae bacterium]
MLEDNHADILGKACSGLGISPGRFPGAFLDSPDEVGLRAAAGSLGLAAGPLAAIARGEYLPDAGLVPDGLAMLTTPFGGMLVNSYVVWDGKSAAAFDTGSDCDGILDLVRERGLRLESVFITHAHGDHIYDLDRLLEKTGAKAWTGEAVAGAELFAPGRGFSLGSLKISTRLTRGHSPSGITYVVEGLSRRIAITGDALFAGSMGGGKVSYADALRTTRDEILSLPPDTLVCPGHGPMTTVGGELVHNPFFAVQVGR